jgi:hypothetical protein
LRVKSKVNERGRVKVFQAQIVISEVQVNTQSMQLQLMQYLPLQISDGEEQYRQ